MSLTAIRGVVLAIMTLAMLGAIALAQEPKFADKQIPAADQHKLMSACTKACSDCQRECDACSTHCARMLGEGKKEHVPMLSFCRDCATICATAAQLVAATVRYRFSFANPVRWLAIAVRRNVLKCRMTNMSSDVRKSV